MRLASTIVSVAASASAVLVAPAIAQEEAGLSAVPSGAYVADPGHAYIAFSYNHQGLSNPILRWTVFDANLDLNVEDPVKSSINVTVPVSEIDSGVAVFDEHLVSADWFDAETYPEITFVITGLTQIDDKTGTLTGDLTIKGQTHPITLDVTFNGTGKSFSSGAPKVGFSAAGEVTRSTWGLGKYAPVVGDEVTLMIEVEFDKVQ